MRLIVIGIGIIVVISIGIIVFDNKAPADKTSTTNMPAEQLIL